jgi:chemotaxis signal transduction protein
MEWFLFKAGSEYLGIEADSVYRIIEDTPIAPVPLTPDSYLGLIYYRGELFEVIDIASLLGYGQIKIEKSARIILVKSTDKKLGLVTDLIIGIQWADDDPIEGKLMLNDHPPIKLMSPNDIWKKMQDLSYGPIQIL